MSSILSLVISLSSMCLFSHKILLHFEAFLSLVRGSCRHTVLDWLTNSFSEAGWAERLRKLAYRISWRRKQFRYLCLFGNVSHSGLCASFSPLGFRDVISPFNNLSVVPASVLPISLYLFTLKYYFVTDQLVLSETELRCSSGQKFCTRGHLTPSAICRLFCMPHTKIPLCNLDLGSQKAWSS